MRQPKYNAYVSSSDIGTAGIWLRDENNNPLPKHEVEQIAARLQAELNHEHKGDETNVYANSTR